MFPAGVPGIRTRYVGLPGGLRLRVAESGDARARPVLLLHGWGASLYMWRAWFAPLSAAGYRPMAVDLPGHGLSDRPDHPDAYRLSAQVAAISALLDAEAMERSLVVAQSMAGTVALELALSGAARVDRLVLINPACFGRVRLQRIGRLLSPAPVARVLPRLVSRWGVARAHRLVYGDPSRITPRDVDEYWAPSQFPSYTRAMWRLVHTFEWRRAPARAMAGRLRELAPPTLVILGGRDRLVRDARPYVATLADAGAPLEVRVLEEGGHAVNEELPETVIPIVLTFLRDEGG
jgi:pimeloyl-ACP methyl ester carboxylesterase